jgi:hypothetical protein
VKNFLSAGRRRRGETPVEATRAQGQPMPMPMKPEATGAPHDKAQADPRSPRIGGHVNSLRYRHRKARPARFRAW